MNRGGVLGGSGSIPSSPVPIEQVNWQGADPFLIIKLLRDEKAVLRLATIVFLSYLPEAGQFSCFFVYLKLVIVPRTSSLLVCDALF